MASRDPAETVAAIRGALEHVAEPADAAPMAAYMKHRAIFLGVRSPARRDATRRCVRAIPEPEALAVAERLWREPEREFQYVATDLVRRHAKRLAPEALPRIRALITTKSWWDTVDALAPTVGEMVETHPQLAMTMDEWIDAENFWLARVALIHQLRFKEATDTGRLFAYCEQRCADTEFFVAKAIGWALRQYSRTDPDAVRDFVDAHAHELRPLSMRAATKYC